MPFLLGLVSFVTSQQTKYLSAFELFVRIADLNHASLRSSQRIQELADGNLEVALTLNSLEEIVPWILSWGRLCEVIRPARLRKKVSSLAIPSA
jgi:hypothetical protein